MLAAASSSSLLRSPVSTHLLLIFHRMGDNQNTDEQCSASIPKAIDNFIPEALIFNGKCGTSVEYILLIQNAYKLLTLKRIRYDDLAYEQCLSFKFLDNGNPQLITNVRNSTADLASLPTTVQSVQSSNYHHS